MKMNELKDRYFRLTLATSEDYPNDERLLCLKECFDELAKHSNFLSNEDVSEIVNFVQNVLSKHADRLT